MAIPQTFDEAFERVKELVSIFSQNEGKYLSAGYSEAQARLEFIDKFWIALGWDVNRETQHDPYKQEVRSSAAWQRVSFANGPIMLFSRPTSAMSGSSWKPRNLMPE